MSQDSAAAAARTAIEKRRVDLDALPAELRMAFREDPAVAMALRARELDVENAPEPTAQGTQICAFFDIDGTLIHGSIVGHLVRQALADGRIGLFSIVIFGIFLLLYKVNLIPRRRMYRWGYGLGAGLSLAESTDFVRRTIDERILTEVFAGARELIERHRSQGHRLVAVTGAPDYAAAHVANALGFDDVLATPTPIEGASLGRELAGPLCYGDGKIPYVHAYAAKHGVDLVSSTFYSDSRSDLPLLDRIGHPVCVNPQLLLRLVAWRRGWPILTLHRGERR
ncbi:MAG: HAD family hydrolase [Pseudomonadota bacterium]